MFGKKVSVSFIKSFIIGTVILVFFIVMKSINFEPVNYINFLDTLLSNHLFEPPIPTNRNIHPVIFIDIDQALMNESGYPVGSKTSRALAAKILSMIRDAGPAVIFLDLDLRDISPEDRFLYDELVKSNPTPVIIPNKIIPFSKTTDQLLALPHNFNGVINDNNVYRAHAEIVNRYGQAYGIYNVLHLSSSEYKQITAASVLAIQLASFNNALSGTPNFLQEKEINKLLLLQYRVGNEKKRWPNSGKKYYYRIPASNVLIENSDLSCIKEGIVVIGASHLGSDDFISTTFGEMPGALFHSNMILELQIGIMNNNPSQNQWLKNIGVDFLLIFINSMLYAAFKLFIDRIGQKTEPIPKNSARIKKRNFFSIIKKYFLKCFSVVTNFLLHLIFYLVVAIWPLLIFYKFLPYFTDYEQSRQYAILIAICAIGVEVIHNIINFCLDSIEVVAKKILHVISK
ncbi:MAG: hypothetical protein A2464_04840 [Deltaproteobacteria bacterium RIFOXYC2_FULL_48_10]|nr:MAG: hypothetical protein A2464_04840 [Deltaproteobacteria bacterium RIFOXYC2_FULL_48_10]